MEYRDGPGSLRVSYLFFMLDVLVVGLKRVEKIRWIADASVIVICFAHYNLYYKNFAPQILMALRRPSLNVLQNLLVLFGNGDGQSGATYSVTYRTKKNGRCTHPQIKTPT